MIESNRIIDYQFSQSEVSGIPRTVEELISELKDKSGVEWGYLLREYSVLDERDDDKDGLGLEEECEVSLNEEQELLVLLVDEVYTFLVTLVNNLDSLYKFLDHPVPTVVTE
jgi:hypothetical protein